jgi:hypothetical protein
MTDWPTARTAIAGILGGVSIDVPDSFTIARVYPTQHANVVDFPCFQIMDAPRRAVRRPGGGREKSYDVRLRFMVKDADLDHADAIIDAFEEATIDAFDSAVTLGLGGGYHVVEGPNWEEKQVFEETKARGVEGTLIVMLKDAINFGP